MSTTASALYDPKNMVFRYTKASGLRLPLFGLGGWLTYGATVKGDPAKDCIKKALELGINFFDTAEGYASGKGEIEMGRVIKELGVERSDLIVSTKIFSGTGSKEPNNKGLSRKHVIEGTKASLRRLQLDYVDLLFAHRPDPTAPMEEVVRAFNWVIDQGWAHYWGTSEVGLRALAIIKSRYQCDPLDRQEIQEAWTVADRLGLAGPVAEQPQYNAFARERFEKEYKPIFQKYGTATTIWSPLDSGFLTGKYNEGIPADSRYATHAERFKPKLDKLRSAQGQENITKVKTLTVVAERLGGNTAQLALAWAASNPNVTSILLGASKPEQLEDNVKALDLLAKLTPEVLEEIEGVLHNKPVPVDDHGRG